MVDFRWDNFFPTGALKTVLFLNKDLKCISKIGSSHDAEVFIGALKLSNALKQSQAKSCRKGKKLVNFFFRQLWKNPLQKAKIFGFSQVHFQKLPF